MTRKDFFAVCGGALATAAGAAVRRPNFVFLLADDLGYGDLACYGHDRILTPNLDRLASEGARFTNFYCPSPVCSPSRAGYVTGRTPTRCGIYDWIPDKSPMHLRGSEITVATLLRKAGYQTSHVGKWHLNGRFNLSEQPQPSDHGFDHWFSTQNNAIPTHHAPRNFVRNGEPVGPLPGYSSTIIADEALRWLKSRDVSRPYCLFVWFHSPHEIVSTAPEFSAPYLASGAAPDEAEYQGNISQLDHEIGRLLAAVGPEGTMVLFSSDNGPETLNRYPNAKRSWGVAKPLRERKLWLYEGGIRVPGIVRYPGLVRAGATVDTPVGGVDLMPTFCELAGAKPSAGGDGTSIVSVLRGRNLKRPGPLFWHYAYALGSPKAAMRDGNFKLLARTDPAPGPADKTTAAEAAAIRSAKLVDFELYNLREDPSETRNLYATAPREARALREKMEAAYRRAVVDAPAWA